MQALQPSSMQALQPSSRHTLPPGTVPHTPTRAKDTIVVVSVDQRLVRHCLLGAHPVHHALRARQAAQEEERRWRRGGPRRVCGGRAATAAGALWPMAANSLGQPPLHTQSRLGQICPNCDGRLPGTASISTPLPPAPPTTNTHTHTHTHARACAHNPSSGHPPNTNTDTPTQPTWLRSVMASFQARAAKCMLCESCTLDRW